MTKSKILEVIVAVFTTKRECGTDRKIGLWKNKKVDFRKIQFVL